MTKNPLINALSATLYISLIAFVMFYGLKNADHSESVVIPIAMISLFTLSAAVMGYIFLSQPLQLYLDGKKKEAVNLFMRTVGIVAVITVLALALVASGLLP